MKKLISCILVIISLSAKSQDSAYTIKVCKDAMADKEYAFGSKVLYCSDNDKDGFTVRISWNNKKGIVSYSGLSVHSVGIGDCQENDELIVLIEDDTKVTLKSWQEFNCKGNSYFDLRGREFNNLNTKKIKAVRFTNGRSYESFTYKLKPNEQSFFIEAKTALDSKDYKQGDCN